MKRAGWILVIALFATTAFAKDYTVSVSLNWDGKDASGATEASLPVTFKVYDASTNQVVSQGQANGPVNELALPSFTISVPDNTTTQKGFYATATDAAGNVSERSAIATINLPGADTLPPAQPVINLIFQ